MSLNIKIINYYKKANLIDYNQKIEEELDKETPDYNLIDEYYSILNEKEDLESSSLNPKIKNANHVFEILKENGIKIFSTDSKGFLGSGDNGVVFNGVVDGKDCVVKVLTGKGADCNVWNRILEVKDKMPEELKVHIPDVYRVVSDNICAIAMERLYPLAPEMKALFESGSNIIYKPSILENIDLISKKIFNVLRASKSGAKSQDHIKRMIEDYLENNKDIKVNSGNLSMWLIKNNNSSVSCLRDIKNVFTTYSSAIPSFYTLDKKSIQGETTISLYKALNWLKENGIGWGDINSKNIMIDKNGTMKIMDVGGFDLVKKSSKNINYRHANLLFFLKLSQQNNDETQDNLEPDLETNLESDWEEAAQEFGSEPVSEKEYLESVSLDPEFGRQKYMLTWLNKHGIKIFNTGKKGWIGQGCNGTVYNGVVDGKDCVVKISDLDSDCTNWSNILKIKNGMPEELKRHIPEIYKIVSEHLPEMRLYSDDACAIAMERLLPIPHDIKVMFGKTNSRYRQSIYDNVDSISKDIYNAIPGTSPSEDDIKEKIIDYLRNNKNLNLNIYYLAKYLPISPIFQWQIVSILRKYSTFPLNFDDDNNYAYNAATESLYKALKWLEKNGVGWGDLHCENIMMDKNGTLKIMDVGNFNSITKTTMRINKLIDIYKTI